MNALELTKTKVFEKLRENKLIDEIALRNLWIKKEYGRRIKNKKPGERKIAIRNKLCEELNISEGLMQEILYSKKSRKKGVNFEIVGKEEKERLTLDEIEKSITG
jgi:hypothetical protein